MIIEFIQHFKNQMARFPVYKTEYKILIMIFSSSINYHLLFILWLLSNPSNLLGQFDTLITNYPNSDQRWEKIYSGEDKVAENIFHSNGVEWMTVQYDDRDSENWKWYYDNGQPYFEALIINDLLEGIYRIWYPNGQLAEELRFRNSLENGPAVFYHENGQIAMSGMYKDGEMIGEWKFFDENGKSPSGIWTWPFAASMKNIRMEGELLNGRRIDSWTYRGTAEQNRKGQKIFTEVYR